MSMMKRLLAILAVACAISPVAAQKAHVDFDHACDFSRYQTYRWAAPPNADLLNQLMQLRVIGFVEEALAAKRLRRVETGGDLLVNFQMDVRQEKVYTTFADTTGFGWGWGWGCHDSYHHHSNNHARHAYRGRSRFAQEQTRFPRRVNRTNQLEARTQHEEAGKGCQ